MMVELARRENLTIRQLYKRVYGQRGHRVVIGTPAEVADALEAWYRGGAADGFNVMPLTMPRGLRGHRRTAYSRTAARKLFRTVYEGKTLREISACRFRKTAGRVERAQKTPDKPEPTEDPMKKFMVLFIAYPADFEKAMKTSRPSNRRKAWTAGCNG